MALQLLVNGEDFTDAWRVYESRWSMRAWQGESVQSEFLIDDPGGSFVHADFAARKIVEVWEDASGSPKCMYRGRIANKSLGPGNFHAPGHAMRWTLQTEDFNIDLRGIRVINADRPEESNYDRAEVIRLAYLNGAASTHPQARDSTDLDGGMYLGPTPGDAVTLDPAVYEDTDPVGVLTQMTEQDGHLFFVYLQNDGVGALAYMKITDEAILSNITVVDDGHDEGADGEDIFAAYWADMAGDHGGQNVLTGAGIRYGDGSYAEESDVSGYEAIYDKWETTFTNDLIYYAVTAEAYVNTTVAANDEVHTYFASIDVKPSHVHRIKAGMMVPLIRKRANKLGNATARAVVVTYEPYKRRSDGEALYRVILELGRPRFLRTIPPKRRKIPRPPTQPVAGACTRLYFSSTASTITTDPTLDGDWVTDSSGGASIKTLKTTADGTLVSTHQNTSSATGAAGGRNVMYTRAAIEMTSGLAAVIAAGGATIRMQARSRARYGTGISESSQDMISQLGVRVTQGDSTTIRGTARTLHALGSSAGSSKWIAQAEKINRKYPAAAASAGLAAVSGAVAGDYLIVEVGTRNYTTVTSGGAICLMNDGSDDLPEDNASVDTALNAWIDICTSETTGDSTEPIGDSGDGSVGTSTKYAPLDHVHEHGLLDPDDVHMHSDEQVHQMIRSSDVDPTVTDDVDAGFVRGWHWNNTTTGDVFFLRDATEGAADWLLLAPETGGSGTQDVRKNSTGSTFSRTRLNFIEGSNVTLTVADDAGNDEVDVTIAASGASGAPSTVDYLVGTADAGLSAEIVVGTTPGGELGGTWASPTVDATHVDAFHYQLNKLNGTTAPTVNDDSGDGYSVGSRWIDTTNDRAYTCVDSTVGAAVWIQGFSEAGDWADISGGTETTTGGYKYCAFTTSGTLTVGTAGHVEVLVVGGGGGGGSYFSGGGGGAGDVTYLESLFLQAGSYTATVGAGGAGATTTTAGGTASGGYGGGGAPSKLGSRVFAMGGGSGLPEESDYVNSASSAAAVKMLGGGSSGGGGGRNDTLPGAMIGGGFSGGEARTGGTGGTGAGGGGGGAGAVGAKGTTGNVGGAGGDGVTISAFSAFGASGVFGGGGGGGGVTTGGAGGTGGGGHGGGTSANTGLTAATANTGGGGGGGGNTSTTGAVGSAGGSGVVLVRAAV